MSTSDLMTTVQAAETLGISRVRVLGFIKQGRLPAQKVGRDWLIRLDDLKIFQESYQTHSRLTEDQVKEIQLRAKQGESVTVLAEQFGVSEQTIYRHIRGAKPTEESRDRAK